jgi:hypothetical protein
MMWIKSFGGTFCFSNCHIIGLDTGGLVFLVCGTECCYSCCYVTKSWTKAFDRGAHTNYATAGILAGGHYSGRQLKSLYVLWRQSIAGFICAAALNMKMYLWTVGWTESQKVQIIPNYSKLFQNYPKQDWKSFQSLPASHILKSLSNEIAPNQEFIWSLKCSRSLFEKRT